MTRPEKSIRDYFSLQTSASASLGADDDAVATGGQGRRLDLPWTLRQNIQTDGDLTIVDTSSNHVSESIWAESDYLGTVDTVSPVLDRRANSSQGTVPEHGQPDRLSRELRREIVKELCEINPGEACALLDSYRKKSKMEGWCECNQNEPTKGKGYIQVSYGGLNKLISLGKVLLWAQGNTLDYPTPPDAVWGISMDGEGRATVVVTTATALPPPLEVSHLCHEPRCMTLGHVTAETAKANNARKGCPVWIACPHCPDQLIMLCSHEPRCIKYHAGYLSQDDLIERGVCSFSPVTGPGGS